MTRSRPCRGRTTLAACCASHLLEREEVVGDRLGLRLTAVDVNSADREQLS